MTQIYTAEFHFFILIIVKQSKLKHLSRAMRKRLMSYANNKGAYQTARMNNKGADQTAHQISAFVVPCLDSTISLDSIAEMSRL